MYFSWVNNLWFHDEKKDRDKTICTKCPEWIRICCHGNNLMTGVCRIKDLHIHTKTTNIYMHTVMYTCIHLHACMHAHTYIHDKYSHNYKALHKWYCNIYMNLEENSSMCFKHRLKHIICSIVLRYFEHFVLTDENKYTCVKCMLSWMNLFRIWMLTCEFECSKRRFPARWRIWMLSTASTRIWIWMM